ncbi:MAG: hypothetical protein ABI469_06580 [Gemmatimonadales bacterium]
MTRSSMVLIGCFTVLAACGRSSSKAEDSTSSAPTASHAGNQPEVAAAKPGGLGSPCPRTGLWALCSVEKRLIQSGFVVKRISGEAPRRAGFSVPPAVYTLGHSRLEVFIYPDEATLTREVAKIDTVTAAPRGARSPWDTPPEFVRSANLAAVFLTDSPQQAERLMLALTAGAPQP